jgi:hypothetical protein
MFMSGHADMTIVKHGVLDADIHRLSKLFTAQSPVAVVDETLVAPPTSPSGD